MCVCMHVSEHDSVLPVYPIELKFGMYMTGHRRTNPTDFGKCRMYSFFYRSTKKNPYTLRHMELNSLKGSSIQTVHSIELKFGMYIVDHCPTYCNNFGGFTINSFFYRSTKKNSYTLQSMESSCKNYASVQTVLPII